MDVYKSSVKMEFRGQDKPHKQAIGKGPNDKNPESFEDEVILNLQQ